MMDDLTGLVNRRGYDARLSSEWNRSKRENSSISVMMIDIDKFKNYNDSYGHLQGDKALIKVAHIIEQTLKRPADFCARWGGEEFVALLPDTELQGAMILAEEVRVIIENTLIPLDNGNTSKVTVSIGVNSVVPGQDSSIQDFIAGADYALYSAKASGRNRVIKFQG